MRHYYRDMSYTVTRQFAGHWFITIQTSAGKRHGCYGARTERHAHAVAKCEIYQEARSRWACRDIPGQPVHYWWGDRVSRAFFRQRRAVRLSMHRGDKIDAANTADWFKLRARGSPWATLARLDAEALELLSDTGDL